MAKRLQMTAEDTTTLLKNIADKYAELYKWDDAGVLYEKFNAVEDAVDAYVSGHSWEDAVRVVSDPTMLTRVNNQAKNVDL